VAGALTTEQIAARQGKPAWFVQDVLRDEQRRGHVEQTPDGRWRVSAKFVERFGRAFGEVRPDQYLNHREDE
jgi:hypothetical protein